MIQPNHRMVIIDSVLTRLVDQMQCNGEAEKIVALDLMITRAAMIIAKKTNEDNAQCILYKPYKMLADELEKKGARENAN